MLPGGAGSGRLSLCLVRRGRFRGRSWPGGLSRNWGWFRNSGSGGGDGAAFACDVADAGGGDEEFEGEAVGGEAKRLHKVLAQSFAGMNRGHGEVWLLHGIPFSDNRRFLHRGRQVPASGKNSPLAVDADGVLADPAAGERLQAVARNHAQIGQDSRSVELIELPLGRMGHAL